MSLVRSVSTNPQLPGMGGPPWLRTLLTARETRQSYVYTCIALWSLCFYLIITNFIGGTIEVDGESMVPTLHNGETYMLNRWSYHFRPPRRGELVVIRDPGYSDLAIKRVVAVGGEHVEIHDSAVFIDGVRLNECYLATKVRTFPAKGTAASFTIPRNHYFVLGDNRSNSLDSRYYGPLHRQLIIGVVSPWGK
jgi:signal peptidase I